MIDPLATPLRRWIWRHHEGNVTHAAKVLGVNRSTLHRVIETAYVIDGTLYTIKTKPRALKELEKVQEKPHFG